MLPSHDEGQACICLNPSHWLLPNNAPLPVAKLSFVLTEPSAGCAPVEVQRACAVQGQQVLGQKLRKQARAPGGQRVQLRHKLALEVGAAQKLPTAVPPQ